MVVELFLLRGAFNNVTTSFSGATFTGLVLKSSSIAFTTKSELYWCLFSVNPITNSYQLNSQIIDANYCYQLLLHFLPKQGTA